MALKIIKIDPYLAPYEEDLKKRVASYKSKKKELVGKDGKLSDFANGYKFFGIHPTKTGWVYREWAPGADEMYFTGDFNKWDLKACPMKKLSLGKKTNMINIFILFLLKNRMYRQAIQISRV